MTARAKRASRRDVLALLRESSGRPLKPKEVGRALGIDTREGYRELKRLLREMQDDGELYKVKGGRYAPPDKINLVTGRFAAARHGGGTVTVEREDAKKSADGVLFIAARHTRNALHGDRVVCRLIDRHTGPLPNAEVIKILERARSELVGLVHVDHGVMHVEPDDPRVDAEILIPPEKAGKAKPGQLVVVEIVTWGDRQNVFVGTIKEILGRPGDKGLDVLIVMKDYGLPASFPEGVEAAATKLAADPATMAPGKRRDLTDLETFTIDPADAKDFDDALSVRPLDDGLIEVGVHIADVGHFVKPGSLIDREAYHRATSVYLVDRVVPMLPEALSNDLCSLVPDEERFAFSVLMAVDDSGKVQRATFTPSLIRSRRRFTYQEVQDLLDGSTKPAGGDAKLMPPLRALATLSERLIAVRRERGSLDFDLPESRVVLDSRGLPIDIQRIERLAAHRLVESFMLLANETVARRLRSRDWPALYRVHDAPDPLATNELRQSLARLGIRLPTSTTRGLSPRMLQKALAEAEESPAEELVNTLVLRSMKRAIYHPEPRGHFGLATRNYCHFTSPIRRYPDLIVHRVLRGIVQRGKPPIEDPAWMERAGEHCSERERVAQEAERASIELKKVQLMSEHIGETFEGKIVGVASFGFFVEPDAYHLQGLVHVNRLEDDYYHFDANNLSLLGERTGRAFKLGDRVRVEVTRADIARRQIDFDLVPR